MDFWVGVEWMVYNYINKDVEANVEKDRVYTVVGRGEKEIRGGVEISLLHIRPMDVLRPRRRLRSIKNPAKNSNPQQKLLHPQIQIHSVVRSIHNHDLSRIQVNVIQKKKRNT